MAGTSGDTARCGGSCRAPSRNELRAAAIAARWASSACARRRCKALAACSALRRDRRCRSSMLAQLCIRDPFVSSMSAGIWSGEVRSTRANRTGNLLRAAADYQGRMSDVRALTTAEGRLTDVCRAAVVALQAEGAAVTLFAAAGPHLALATDQTAGMLER